MNIEYILQCFPQNISCVLENELNKNNLKERVEEIRIKINSPIIINSSVEEIVVNYRVKENEISHVLQKICENSLYSYQKQIASGYITIKGGNRVGLVGSGIIEDEKIINLNYISSLNFRISRQIKDCSMPIIYEILDIENNSIFNTLIVSPPGVGKTTLLKDIIEKISDGIKGFKGLRVAVIDERGEIAASYKGSAQNDLGIRTDILDNISKDIGMKMAIRSMAPKVIVADEIGSKEDSEAIRYAIRCGVKGIFTAHGSSIEEIAHNPELNCLIKEQVFDNVILLKRRTGKTIEKAIYKVKGESWK